jgi:pimeloyl-ACP methyl ester carboxylesterase
MVAGRSTSVNITASPAGTSLDAVVTGLPARRKTCRHHVSVLNRIPRCCPSSRSDSPLRCHRAYTRRICRARGEVVDSNLPIRLYGQSRIVLIGHSWGGALALLYAHAHPDKIAAVIAVTPLVDMFAQQQAQYAFVLVQAAQHKDREVLERLCAIGPLPHRSADDTIAVERLADRYDAVYHVRPNRMWVMFEGVLRGLVTAWEITRFIRGNNVSLAAMNDELLGLRLVETVPSLDVPVFFFLGRYDHHLDAEIAVQYLDALQAPLKPVAWFENSAHNIPFEEPAAFTKSVVEALHVVGIGALKAPR